MKGLMEIISTDSIYPDRERQTLTGLEPYTTGLRTSDK